MVWTRNPNFSPDFDHLGNATTAATFNVVSIVVPLVLCVTIVIIATIIIVVKVVIRKKRLAYQGQLRYIKINEG